MTNSQTENVKLPGWQKRATILQVAAALVVAIMALLGTLVGAQSRIVHVEDRVTALESSSRTTLSANQQEIGMLGQIQTEMAGMQERLQDISSRIDRIQQRQH